MDETGKRSNRCSQTWSPVRTALPPWRSHHVEQDSQDHRVKMQSSPPSRFFEELFCSGQISNALLPLTLVTSTGPQSDVVKKGYLGKLDRNHRRYFVLRAGSHTGPGRLEWYKNQEKFTAMESAGKAALFGSSKQGVIYLRCCLGVSRIRSTRNGHTLAVYARDQTMVLAMENQREQEEWYLAVKKLMEEEQMEDEYGEGFDEDDGYCTLPPAAFFKEVWPVTVKPRDLGSSKSLAGESRLCLTSSSLILVRVSADLPSVKIPLLRIRRFGHLDGSFFLELGRSAPNGPGEIWMEARDQGSPAVAQHIHEEVRDAVKALRALPDFSRSPNSTRNHPQTLLASKRCRPKCRDKLGNVRPLGSRPTLPPRSSESQTSSARIEVQKPESTLSLTSDLQQSTTSGAGTGYMEMTMDCLPVNKGQENDAACEMEGWESEEEERLGYVMMSPAGSHSSSSLPQDDYVTMMSPSKGEWPADSCRQSSVSISTSDSCLSLNLSHQQPAWRLTPFQPSEADACQALIIGSATRPQDDAGQEQTSAVQRQPPINTVSSPVRTTDGREMTPPSMTRGSGCASPLQSSLTPSPSWSGRLRAASGQSARRCRLSMCLPCLQADDT